MRRFIIIGLCLLFASANVSHAQQWISDYVNENGFNADSIVSHIRVKMQESTGKKVHNFPLTLLGDHSSVDVRAAVDRPTILMFWNTSCSASRMQLRELEILRKTYSEDELNIFYVSPESDSTLKDFQLEHSVSNTLARVDKGDLQEPYQTFATPSLFLLNDSDTIIETWLEPKKMDELEQLVSPLME